MYPRTQTRLPRCPHRSSLRFVGAILALCLPLTLATGCGDELESEFRSAAIGGIETGVDSIVNGLLDGLFTIAEPSNGGSGTTAADTGGTDG